MSEILRIDTAANLLEEVIKPLPIYDDNLPLLKEVMPEYTGEIPSFELMELIKRLKMTRKTYNGIGLSANQCGIKFRCFIIGHNDWDIVFINPKVIATSAEIKLDNEGCLSYPGLYVRITRPTWVDVEYTNELGKIVSTRLDGLTARCYLHELDHMNGIKFIEHVGPLALKIAKEKQAKRIKKHLRQRKK